MGNLFSAFGRGKSSAQKLAKQSAEQSKNQFDRTMLKAKQGVAESQYCLGSFYERGEGVDQDYTEAIQVSPIGGRPNKEKWMLSIM